MGPVKHNKSQPLFLQLPVRIFTAILQMPLGTILVPSGGVFTTAPFNLTSHQVLHVEVNATLLGTLNTSQIPIMGVCLHHDHLKFFLNQFTRVASAPFPSYGESRDGHPARSDNSHYAQADLTSMWNIRFAPLVGAFNETNITITGGGTINGQGKWWWDGGNKVYSKRNVACTTHSSSRLELLDRTSKANIQRPRLVELQYVDGLTIANIHLLNSPFWVRAIPHSPLIAMRPVHMSVCVCMLQTVHPIYCNNVHVHHVNITAEGKGQFGRFARPPS